MKYLSKIFVFAGVMMLVSCGSQKKEEANDDEMASDTETEMAEEVSPMAIAMISSASGSTMGGEADFVDNGDGTVTLNLKITGAVPGEHALHLHEHGDCSAPDATSAGGHWNPGMTDHGKRMAEGGDFHAGDIDNIVVGADSTGTLTMVVHGWSVGGPDSTNVIGKSIILHAKADDFVSQPSGAAGAREGCGVITAK
ncbi:MAG TPA: superoxide dismutase family protein [Fulvivirga sp.]|nr:superoxide dismutase family protein [Fulvivirga sp.]